MDTFNFRGKIVEVYTDIFATGKDWRLRWTEPDGLIKEYELSGYPGDKGPQIQVDYSWRILRASDNKVQSSGTGDYYEPNLLGFYKATIPSTMWYGHWAAIQSVNGLIARLPEFEGSKEDPAAGYRVFRADGTFYQPVTFDVAITQPNYEDPAPANGQIDITPVDGVGPFQYSLDGGAFQGSGTFTDLAPGEHTVRVEDSEGTYRERVVQLANQFELMNNV